jgi:hypothetical protein
MRRVLLVAALLATTAGLSLAATTAHASTYLHCDDGFHQLRGKAGSNPPVSATVARQDDGKWSVVYVLRDGQTVMRENQYDIADKGNGVGWTGWKGEKQMCASIEHYNGRLIYAEAVYSGGEKLVASNYIDCGAAPASEPDYTPPVEASAPATGYTINGKPWTPPADTAPAYVAPTPAYLAPPSAAPSGQVVVALNPPRPGSKLHAITFVVGSTPTTALVDSGCFDLSIGPDLADALVAKGEATWGEYVDTTIAGGATSHVRLLTIHRVTIGGRVLSEVEADNGAADGMQLLGSGVLNQFGRFSIDLNTASLVLG